MARINVTRDYTGDSDYSITGACLGWFDPEAAAEYDESTDWDGSNHISVNTGTQWDHESLYRTAGGRWVLCQYSNWQGALPAYAFVTDNAARDWLMLNELDDAVTEHFGPAEPERGPGRPEVGSAVHVRLGDLLGPLDLYAGERGITRAEAIRQAVAALIDSRNAALLGV